MLKTADNEGMEIENIFDYFNDIKIISNHDGYFYSVKEALKILLLGLLCGRKNIREIHEWATEDIIKEKLRKEFGIEKIPCYYWLTCLLKLINIDSLNECFMNMAEALIKEYGTEKPLTIAIDGKTIRSTDKMSSYESPLHIVSAQVAEFGITLAQKCVKGKTNEIPTVQALIKTLNIKGHIIVADALNCQKETAKIIKEGKGDYLLSVKGNQPLLKTDIEEYVQDEILRKQMETACKSEKNRERVEKRTAFCTTNLGWMDNTDEWEGLSCIGAIHSEFKSKKGKSDEWHYYISSRKLTAQQLLDIARKEWVVETMHWLLDVHFREDFCRLLDKNLQQALNIGRKVALNLVSRYKQKNAPKSSLSHIMFKALMDISFIKKILQN